MHTVRTSLCDTRPRLRHTAFECSVRKECSISEQLNELRSRRVDSRGVEPSPFQSCVVRQSSHGPSLGWLQKQFQRQRQSPDQSIPPTGLSQSAQGFVLLYFLEEMRGLLYTRATCLLREIRQPFGWLSAACPHRFLADLKSSRPCLGYAT